ncbi:hypothetical protein PQR15_25335 [Streptomyces lydicus]|nr:hypothetical protein [Streptomyces lydicus]
MGRRGGSAFGQSVINAFQQLGDDGEGISGSVSASHANWRT